MRYTVSHFKFHPLGESDLPLLRSWLLRPHVAKWWGVADSIAELRHDYLFGANRASGTRAYVVWHANRTIGFIQSYVVMGSGGGWWESESDPGSRGIDQFLGEEADLGQGIGSAMVRAYVERLFSDPEVTVVQTDPSPENTRAIRSYEKVGFQTIGPVTTPDGAAVLMRLTREAFLVPQTR